MHYQFDGTYHGFLTGIFEAFEKKEFNKYPTFKQRESISLFDEMTMITTDIVKAQRVLKGLESKIGKNRAFDFYRGFLSEDEAAWKSMFILIVKIFQGQTNILDNFGDEDVLYFSQTLKKVSRERHRMKAFIRFNKDENGLFTAIIEPDFNVLPLIIKFFKDRYTDQPWLIYDIKRKYGMYYNLENVEEVEMIPTEAEISLPIVSIEMDSQEELYQKLWKQYFKSTNIVERKNMKLHLRHVPRRYWKYLVEKQ